MAVPNRNSSNLSTKEAADMKFNRYFLMLLMVCISGCQHVDSSKQPMSMPRSALLSNYLPGILPPQNEHINHCEDDVTSKSKQESVLIKQALAGSSKAALSLAKLRRHASIQGMLYWFTIAAENDSVRGMEIIGTNLYSGSSTADAIGSKARGRFWLELAATKGSKIARKYLKEDEAFQNNDLSLPPNPGVSAKQSSSAGQSINEPMVRCGGFQRCEEIPLLEHKALAGSGQIASYLSSYLSHYGDSLGGQDRLYWATIAAENGYAYAMGLLGSSLMDGSNVNGCKIRGKFWLEKAASSGDAFALRQLKNVSSPPLPRL
jgi:hypothetical protein